MKRYRMLKRGLTAFLILYCLGGFLGHAAPRRWLPHREFYPFYSWFLFARVPQPEEKIYGLRLLELGGRPVDPPILFQQATNQIWNAESFSALVIIQQMGEAQESGNLENVEKYRRIFESNYLPPPARYELVKIIYPLRKPSAWASLPLESLRAFSTSDGPL